MGKGVPAFDVNQVGRAMRPQGLAVGQQKVERPMLRDLRHQLAQREREFGHAGHAGMGFGHLLHQPAKGPLAVGVAHRPERAMQARVEALEVAVVREHPVVAPQLPHEGVAVLQRHHTLRRPADVRDDVAALDGVTLDQLGHR